MLENILRSVAVSNEDYSGSNDLAGLGCVAAIALFPSLEHYALLVWHTLVNF